MSGAEIQKNCEIKKSKEGFLICDSAVKKNVGIRHGELNV